MINFLDITYLSTGTPIQQCAYQDINDHKIMTLLEGYNPVLAGTIPIDIAISSSDLDIICCFKSAGKFYDHLLTVFESQLNFTCRITNINNEQSVIASFNTNNFKYEIFGQSIPIVNQDSYRHMVTEYKILNNKGVAFRKKIIALKNAGYKTEHAFAKLLNLQGNPYKALLEF